MVAESAQIGTIASSLFNRLLEGEMSVEGAVEQASQGAAMASTQLAADALAGLSGTLVSR